MSTIAQVAAPRIPAAFERLVAAVEAMTAKERVLWAAALIDKAPVVPSINSAAADRVVADATGLASTGWSPICEAVCSPMSLEVRNHAISTTWKRWSLRRDLHLTKTADPIVPHAAVVKDLQQRH